MSRDRPNQTGPDPRPRGRSPQPRRLRAWFLLTIALGMLAIGSVSPQPAAAHTTEDPYLYLFITEPATGSEQSTQGPIGLDGRIELSVADLETLFGVNFGDEDPAIKAALDQDGDRIRDYAAKHLAIDTGGTDVDQQSAGWPISFGDVELFRERDDLAFAVVPYTVDVPSDLTEAPTELSVRFDPFAVEIESGQIDERTGLLLLTGGWTAGSFDRQAEALITFDGDSLSQTVDLGDRTQWQNFVSSIGLGVDHIKTGPDHIMFVLALLLPSVLVFSGSWQPVSGFGSALWRVLKIATFFTLAHSITFTLAGMGWLPLPPAKLVESIIAISIAAAALHNLKPIFPNREWTLSFLFGLFHGMGFASLVAALEVSRTSQLVSLVGRNVGIEIGQVVVILVSFPALYLLRRTSFYEPVLTIGSILLAVMSVSWMIERLFEVDLGTDSVVDALVQLPRGYVVAAVATVVAYVVYRQQSKQDRLIPVHTT